MLKKLFIIIALPLFLANCSALTGEEIARLEINKVSTGKDNMFNDRTILELKKK